MDASTATAIGYFFASIPPTLMALAAWRQGRSNGTAVKDVAADLKAVKTESTAANAAAGTAAARAEVAAGKAQSAATLAQDANGKADLIIAGNTEIHRLVNSGTDKLKNELATVKQELADARTEQAAASERTEKLAATVERLLAQAAAGPPATHPPA